MSQGIKVWQIYPVLIKVEGGQLHSQSAKITTHTVVTLVLYQNFHGHRHTKGSHAFSLNLV